MINIQTDISLLPYNTFGIQAKAAYFIEYTSTDELREAISWLQSPSVKSLPVLHIGGGSNLLFTQDFPGVILHSRMEGLKIVSEGKKDDAEATDDILLRVASGMVWDDFVAYCVEHGYYGAENLSLIPGEVGASAIQNIGAYGAEAGDIIDSVELMSLSTGESRVMSSADCQYSYRQSIFKNELRGEYAVTYVTFRLHRTFSPKLDYGNVRSELEKRGLDITAANVRQVIIDIRRAKLPDPAQLGNAGSFFMNPIISRSAYEQLLTAHPDMPHYDVDQDRVKVPAGWLIDRCGWKGQSLGAAGVHAHQALVLVNRGGATGADIIALSDAVRASVRERFGIDIHPEVNFI